MAGEGEGEALNHWLTALWLELWTAILSPQGGGGSCSLKSLLIIFRQPGGWSRGLQPWQEYQHSSQSQEKHQKDFMQHFVFFCI